MHPDSDLDAQRAHRFRVKAAVASLLACGEEFVEEAIDALIECEPAALLVAISSKFLHQKKDLADVTRQLDELRGYRPPPPRRRCELVLLPSPAGKSGRGRRQ